LIPRLESPFKAIRHYEEYQAYEHNNMEVAKSQPEDYQDYQDYKRMWYNGNIH